jgi:E3 ubiquitin-protein ligase XIAP/baculoviral IAP repeat-containing protein 2/3
MTSSQTINVYFKRVRTSETATYQVNISWTLSQFITIMREKVIRDFNLENVEFIDTAHHASPGVSAEDMPAIRPGNMTLLDKYGPRLYNLSFYIRPISINATTDSVDATALAIPEEEETTSATHDLPRERSCVICMSQERTMLFMPCNHLCTCTSCGLNPAIRACPICRGSFVNRISVYV